MKQNGQEFECYSKKVHGFLMMKGFRYVRRFKHNQTSRVCWVYEMTDELSNALIEWKQNRPSDK